jgi:ubiquinone/menaquinone biosynthesis C-methylase UbiE
LGCEESLTANVFDEMGVYWAEIADHNQTGKQLQFLKDHFKPDGYVLDVACGTGRHMIPLSQQGYGMVGLDVSANLLKITKQRSKEIQLVRGDMRFLPFKPQVFAGVISMDTSFGYLPSESDDSVTLVEVKRVLNQRGVFVIDVFNREELTRKYQNKSLPTKWREYPSFFLLQKRTVSPKGEWLWDLWTIEDKAVRRLSIFEHAVRLYERGKLERMLEKAGFAVKKVYGGYEEENFSPESSRLILVTFAK